MADQISRGTPTYEALVEQALVGVYVVQDNRIVYANPRLADLFGYSVGELLALPSVDTLIDPADRGMVSERLRQRISGETTTSTHAMTGIRRDGSRVEVDVYSTRTEHDGRPAVTGTMIDVTERRERERMLEARERRYRDLFENAADILFTCDLAGCITSLNRAGERLTGFMAAEAMAMRLADLAPGSNRGLVDDLIQRQGRERQDVTSEFEIVTRRGERKVLEVSTSLIERHGEPVEIQGIARDVTDRKEREEALRNLTIVDDLTKLYNRRGFLTLAERHLKLATRKKHGVFLLFADLDGLKAINDAYGHLEGDRALLDAADLLRHSFRSADIIARLGGDEFTVFPIEAVAESGQMLVHRLQQHLDAHNEAHRSRGYRLALSVGIARFEPDSTLTIDQLLAHADRALYEQKRQRRS